MKRIYIIGMISLISTSGLFAGRFGDYLGAHVLGDVITDVRRDITSPPRKVIVEQRTTGTDYDEVRRVRSQYEEEIRRMRDTHADEMRTLEKNYDRRLKAQADNYEKRLLDKEDEIRNIKKDYERRMNKQAEQYESKIHSLDSKFRKK